MKKGKQKEEGNEVTRPEERKAESSFRGIETYRKDLESQLTTDPARQEGSPTAKAASFVPTDEQVDLLFKLSNSGYSFSSIMEILGIHSGATDRLDSGRVQSEAEIEIIKQKYESKHSFERLQMRSALKITIDEGMIQDEDRKFEAYDVEMWEAATKKETVDKARNKENVTEPHLSPNNEVVRETSGIPTSPIIRDPEDLEKEHELKLELKFPLGPEFVRALKDSKTNTKPYFRKGHILRVINKARRGKLDGELNRYWSRWTAV